MKRGIALLLVCLLAGQAVHALESRSLLAYSLSAIVQAGGVDENTLAASTDDLSCECGYVSDFKYQLSAGKLTQVLIACRDITTDAVHPAATTLWKDASGATVTDFTGWTDATLDGTTSGLVSSTDAVAYVNVLAISGGFSEFASSNGAATAVTCGSDAIVGLSLDKDGSGNVIRITATCATTADVVCDHYNAPSNTCYKYGDDGKEVNWATNSLTGTANTGTYIDLSTNQCTECPAGTYLESDGDETWTCTPCPAGKYRSTTGGYLVGACTNCAAGTWAPQVGTVTCDQAPLGSWTAAGADTLNWCAAGKIGKADRLSCADCPAGYWRPGGDASPTNNLCYRIPAGYRTTVATGASSIALCPAGTAAAWDTTGTPVNQWTFESGSVDDPASKRTPTNPQECNPCGIGSWSAMTGSAQCFKCKNGNQPTTQTLASLSISDITPYAGAADTTFVIRTGCEPCAAHYYKNDASPNDICQVCLAGKETGAPSGATSCDDCAPGFVNMVAGATLISSDYLPLASYPDSYSAASAGADAYGFWTTCIPCPKNTYDDGSGQCKLCPAGTSTDGTGNTECAPCPGGSYSASAFSECVLADVGSYVDSAGATAQQACSAGYVAKDKGSVSCEPCPAGTYTVGSDRSACTACSAGTYSTGKASICKGCPAGTFSKAGARQCTRCPAGQYNTKPSQGSCVKSSAGYYAAGTGNTSQKPCPKGQYSTGQGQSQCKKCAVNTYQPAIGKNACIPCCKPGTSIAAGTCRLWTRGQTGASQCQVTRARRMS